MAVTYNNTLENNADNMSKSPRLLNLTLSSTFVVGACSYSQYLICDVNGRNVGIPIYKFAYSTPEIDLLIPYTDFVVKNAQIVDSATAYNAGMAIGFTFYTTATTLSGYSAVGALTSTQYVASVLSAVNDYAFPIFKPPTQDVSTPTVKVTTPTLVAGNFMPTVSCIVANINDEAYGIPLWNYSELYPFTETLVMSSLNVGTTFYVNPTIYDAPKGSGSTNLNSKIKTYADVIRRIKTQLGYPFVNIEVCDDSQIVDFIDLALEWYTKYTGYTEEFLIFRSDLYKEPGLQIDKLFSITPNMRNTLANGMSACWDYDLGDYRKVAGVFAFEPGESTGINTLFTLEQAMAQQTYFSYMLGNAGFDLVTWEVLKEWLDLREKVLAQTYYVDFDERNQLLRLIPPPNQNSGFWGVIGCWVEKPIAHLISEQWVQKYALALTKIAVGNVRGKYQGMQMFGGGTINYNDLLSQGLKEKDALEKGLQDGEWYDTAPPRFFLG